MLALFENWHGGNLVLLGFALVIALTVACVVSGGTVFMLSTGPKKKKVTGKIACVLTLVCLIIVGGGTVAGYLLSDNVAQAHTRDVRSYIESVSPYFPTEDVVEIGEFGGYPSVSFENSQCAYEVHIRHSEDGTLYLRVNNLTNVSLLDTFGSDFMLPAQAVEIVEQVCAAPAR